MARPNNDRIAALRQKAKDAAKVYRQKAKVALKARADARKASKMMPFCGELAHGVMVGKTVASFRYNKYSFYPRAGEQFTANVGHSGLQAVFRCVSIKKTTLRDVRDNHWRTIGVPSQEAYMDLMRVILKTDLLDLDKKGFLYSFERLS